MNVNATLVNEGKTVAELEAVLRQRRVSTFPVGATVVWADLKDTYTYHFGVVRVNGDLKTILSVDYNWIGNLFPGEAFEKLFRLVHTSPGVVYAFDVRNLVIQSEQDGLNVQP